LVAATTNWVVHCKETVRRSCDRSRSTQRSHEMRDMNSPPHEMRWDEWYEPSFESCYCVMPWKFMGRQLLCSVSFSGHTTVLQHPGLWDNLDEPVPER